VIRRAAERFHSVHGGVRSWHCFSAGTHYDPDNVAHGGLIAVDEHHVAPGSGFDWHGHRGVTIVSYVASGRLRHENDAGDVRLVDAEEVLVQHAGSGIRHREANPSAHEPLLLVQTTVVGDGDDLRFEVWTGDGRLIAPRWHAFVVDGGWRLDDTDLAPGDSVRGHDELAITGSGTLLVVVLSAG
jgi:quercetin 2,3-dioxygenase